VTGTRGKTTVTNWVSALLSNTHRSIAPTGNNPENALLKEIRHVRPHQPVVAELSSWQLELLPRSGKAPHIAAITNLYPDHLNRYRNIKAYANAKALIFKDQTQDDFLILNHDSAWCNYFLSKKPRAQLYFVSQQSLPKNRNGIFLENGHVMFQSNGVKKPIVSITTFRENWGAHNVENLLVSILAVLLYDLHVPITQSMIRSLAGVRYRQELVFEDRTARFYNDTTATSPDALISSIERFAGSNTLFIVGGTDKKLPFAHCANVIAQKTDNEHMIFLSGTATTKLLTELKKLRFFKNTEPVVFDSLLQCVAYAYTHTRKNKTSIVFSPGGSSFEKFKNEFHRGELFEKYVRHVTHTSH
jgi:UDP-N-acetylmuramoylalanine--D-glutamate ligase